MLASMCFSGDGTMQTVCKILPKLKAGPAH
jgi:hypothetical protein